MCVDDRLRALANPTRRALLTLVRDVPRPVAELSEAVGASQPATSQHLAVLRGAGLVSVTPMGRQRLYRAEHGAVAETRAFLDDYWSSAVDRLSIAAEQRAAERTEAS